MNSYVDLFLRRGVYTHVYGHVCSPMGYLGIPYSWEVLLKKLEIIIYIHMAIKMAINFSPRTERSYVIVLTDRVGVVLISTIEMAVIDSHFDSHFEPRLIKLGPNLGPNLIFFKNIIFHINTETNGF